jgi:hypothetical protein
MTRAGGALRGGIAGLVWAAFFLVTGAALLRLTSVTRSVVGVGYLLDFFAPTAGEPAKWLVFGAAGGFAGVIVGLIGCRLHSDPWRRVATLWVAFYPAGGLGLGTVMYLSSMVFGPRGLNLWDLAVAPVALPAMGLMLAVAGLVFFPLLALPLMAAALTTEAWTRPEELEQSPLARPRVQRAMVAVLVTVTGVALVYLWASWKVAPGTTWLVP